MGLVEVARIGVSGGVVTREHSDLCVFTVMRPTPPLRRLGVPLLA